MGRAKREMEAVAERWDYKAGAEGYRCAVCGMAPIYDEREIFFETGLCGYCAHMANKDD